MTWSSPSVEMDGAGPLPTGKVLRSGVISRRFDIRFRRGALRALLALACFAPPAGATPPAPDGSVSNAVRDAAAQGLFALPENAATGTSAISADWLIPVILVGFPDSTTRVPPAQLQFTIFDTTNATPTGSLVDYYRWASGGRLRVRGEVVAAVTLPNPEGYYAAGANGVDALATPNNDWGLVRDALFAANPLVDWNRYDRDGDGFVDMLWVVHAGLGGELTTSRTNLWSITSRLSAGWSRGGPIETDDFLPGSLTQHVRVDRFSILPEISGFRPGQVTEIGVYCHEFGHALGLPDLYDASVLGGTSNVGPGNWSLMSTGAYGGDNHSPETPTGMGAWPMLYLGWANRSRPAQDTTVTLKPYSRGGVVQEFWFQGESNPEHFLLECRDLEGFDAKLPGAGLMVYQVDDAAIGARLASNRVNAGPVPGLRILEGDGRSDLITGRNRGEGSDVLPGPQNRTQLDDDTSPSLRSIGGAVTNLALTGITRVAGDVRASLQVRAPGWLPAEPVADAGASPAGTPTRAHHAFVTGAGQEYDAFCDDRGGTLQVYLRSRSFAGAWTAPVLVSEGSPGASQPTLAALPGGGLALAWIDTRSGSEQVWFRTRVGGYWTAPRQISTRPTACASPSLAVDPSGRVTMAWIERGVPHPSVQFVAFLWTFPFGQPVALTDSLNDPASPLVTCNGRGQACVVWSDRGTGTYMLLFARFHPDSGVGPRLRLTAAVPFPQPAFDVLLDDDGTLHTVYQQNSSGASEIHYMRRFIPGLNGARDTTIEASADGLQNPRLATDIAHGLHVTFEHSASWGQQLRYRRWRADHGWDARSTDATGPEDGSVADASLLAVTPGNVSLLYASSDGVTTLPRTRRRRLDGGAAAAVPGLTVPSRAGVAFAPNPVRAGAPLAWAGARLEPGATLDLLDATGRRVARTRADAAGAAHFPSETTGTLAPGLYFARVQGERTGRIVVLR